MSAFFSGGFILSAREALTFRGCSTRRELRCEEMRVDDDAEEQKISTTAVYMVCIYGCLLFFEIINAGFSSKYCGFDRREF